MRPRGTVAALLAPLALAGVLLAPAGCARSAAPDTVTVLGPWTSGAEYNDFQKVVTAFQNASGDKVNYVGATGLDAVLGADIAKGTPPDVAILPSPGALRSYALDYGTAGLKTLPAEPGRYRPLWHQIASVNGRLYAVVVTAALKSAVWYSPPAIAPFEPASWHGRPPATWTQLETLTSAISRHHQFPWCMGVGATSQSGWPGTDWIEDIVLHRYGTKVYSAWADGTLPWTDPRIRDAWLQWAALLPQVRGGSDGVLFTDAGDAGTPMTGHPPGCYLDHEAFQSSPAPKPRSSARPATFDYFPFPALGAPSPAASEVSADLAGMFRKTAGAQALLAFLASDRGQRIWPSLANGDQFSADENLTPTADPSAYGSYRNLTPQPMRADIEGTLTGADTLCFDASDLMPPDLSDAFEQAVLAVLGDPQRYIGTKGGLEPLLASLEQVSQRAYRQQFRTAHATFSCAP